MLNYFCLVILEDWIYKFFCQYGQRDCQNHFVLQTHHVFMKLRTFLLLECKTNQDCDSEPEKTIHKHNVSKHFEFEKWHFDVHDLPANKWTLDKYVILLDCWHFLLISWDIVRFLTSFTRIIVYIKSLNVLITYARTLSLIVLFTIN